MSTIHNDMKEWVGIKTDIAYHSKQLKFLRKKKKELETKIISYLVANNLPGVKYHGIAFLLEEKTQKVPKSKEERNDKAMEILKQHGIRDTETVLDEVLKARQGDEVLVNKIKVKKYNN